MTLNALQDSNWTDVNTKVVDCLAHHLRAEELKRQMELAYRERDLLLTPITETVKASRDLLLGVFRANTAQDTLTWRSSKPITHPNAFVSVGVLVYIGC